MARKHTHGYPKVARALKRAGFQVIRTKRHAVWRHPDGRQLTMPESPSDSYRGERNAVADARRIGVDI